jgi:hypothetical protein
LKSGVSYQRGHYLVQHVAQCASCHTSAGGFFTDSDPLSGAVDKKALDRSILFLPELVNFNGSFANKFFTDITEENLDPNEAVSALISAGKFPLLGPDIRGNSAPGLLAWTSSQIESYLKTGTNPEGRKVDGRLCPWPFYSNISDDDRSSIAAFIKGNAL